MNAKEPKRTPMPQNVIDFYAATAREAERRAQRTGQPCYSEQARLLLHQLRVAAGLE